MAITPYASANTAPIPNPDEDAEYDLSTFALGGSVNLYGDAADSADASPVWTWSWSILAKGTGSAAAIGTATNQNITVSPVDVWTNIRLFLVATNTNSGASSETDPLRAPSSAFVVIRVLSVDKGLQKIAAGERNWFDDQWDLVQAVEDLNPAVAHNIIDHADVTAATGADLDVLTQGAYALDPAGANPVNAEGYCPLHKHYGSTVNAATNLARGTVKLREAWTGGGEPEAVTRETVVYSGSAYHSQPDGGLVELVLPHGNGFNATDFTKMLPVHILWAIPRKCTIKTFDVCLMSVPRRVGTGKYKFALRQYTTLANIENEVPTNVSNSAFTVEGPTVVDGPLAASQTVGTAITGPCWIGVQVVEAPDTAPEYAFGLQATMYTEV